MPDAKKMAVGAMLAALLLGGCASNKTIPQVQYEMRGMTPASQYAYLLSHAQGGSTVGDLIEPPRLRGVVIQADSVVIGLGDRGTEHLDPKMVNDLLKLLPFDPAMSSRILRSKDSAPVHLTAFIPPFVRDKQKIDVMVSALDAGVNLENGQLPDTPLRDYRPPVGKVVDPAFVTRSGLVAGHLWAYSRGQVTLTPPYVDGKPSQPVRPEVGYVPAGALVQENGIPSLILKRSDAYTALLVQSAITQRFPKRAGAIQTGMVTIGLPNVYRNEWPRYVDVLTHIPLKLPADVDALNSRLTAMVRRLDATDPDQRYDAELSLEAYGRLGAPLLQTLLPTVSQQARRAIIRVLVHMQDTQIIDPLIAESRSAEAMYRLQAAHLLGIVQDKPTAAISARLVEMLSDADPLVRYAAMRSIEDLKISVPQARAYFARKHDFVLEYVPIKETPAVVVKSRNGVRYIDIFGESVEVKPGFHASVGTAEVTVGEDGVRVRLKYLPEQTPVAMPDFNLTTLVRRLDLLDVSINDIVALIAEMNNQKALNAPVVWVK